MESIQQVRVGRLENLLELYRNWTGAFS